MTNGTSSVQRRWSETDRLSALESYGIMDTPDEAEFDDIARIAAQICNVPLALITVLDAKRQWFKARVGVEETETPREIAFCNHTIEQDGVFEIADMTQDPRFLENPLVTGEHRLRFYAGAPIRTSEGLPIGTLCVLDRSPHALNDGQRTALEALARQVMSQMELRRALSRQRAEDRRFRLILESAVDYAIISMDLAGLVTSWNQGACRILGWTEEEMFGHRCDVLFTDEDRAANIPAAEMNAALQHGRGTDERWHLRKDGSRFWANGEMMPLTDDDDRPVGFIKILRDRTEERLAREHLEEQRSLLIDELKHRIKNTLAVVQGIVSQSLRDVATPAEARQAIGDRLAMLARAHDLLTQTSWSATPIGAVVDGAIRVVGSLTSRIHIGGPPLALRAQSALALTMVIHELCTNAVKYGALSNDAGEVRFDWRLNGSGEDATVEIEWQESGGPEVTHPKRSGFGSKLMESALRRDLGGPGRLDFRPAGLQWSLSARRKDVEEV